MNLKGANLSVADPGVGIEIADPLNLIQHLMGYQVALATFYSAAFVCGSTGNLYVISIVIYVLRTLRDSPSLQTRHVFVYILCLSCVDLCVLLTIPLLITDMLLTTWIYGSLACKVYLVMENLNKVLSVFILTTLGADRFMAIQFPTASQHLRTQKVAFLAVSICFLFAASIMSPLPVWGRLYYFSYNATFAGDNSSYLVRVTKCTFYPPTAFYHSFIAYSFTLCYCLPATAILVFYAGIILAISIHRRHNSATSIPFRRILRYIILGTGFYFLCWSPYWIFTVLFQLLLDDIPNFTVISYICHALPYVNCSINPIIYALLNRELRHSHTMAVKQNHRRATQDTRSGIDTSFTLPSKSSIFRLFRQHNGLSQGRRRSQVSIFENGCGSRNSSTVVVDRKAQSLLRPNGYVDGHQLPNDLANIKSNQECML